MASSVERVVITGVTQGLGFEMTNWFQAHGHIVLGCGRNQDKIDEMNARFCGSGTRKQFSIVNVVDNANVERWAKNVVTEFGAPTFLINNAGLTNKSNNLWNVPVDEFNRVVDVNVKGPVNLIRHFVPSMIAAKRGVIVNFSSGWGRSVAPEVAPYCCTKWGIEGLSKALAMDLPPPLTCVPLDPGMINTAMTQEVFGGGQAQRLRSPSQWAAQACPFILSINRRHNGQSLTI